jgi:hypothetical protein
MDQTASAPPRLWPGLEVLVLARAPGLAESVRAAAAVHVEKVSAFSEFPSAYDHAKKTRAVGLVLAADDLPDLPLSGVVSQIGRPFESKGWQCFGALILTGAAVAPEELLRGDRLLAAWPRRRLESAAAAGPVLRRLWHVHARACETQLLPESLRRTLLALAAPLLPAASALFQERAALILGGAAGGLGLNWFELLGVQWLPVVEALQRCAPRALEANPGLAGLCRLARPETQPRDLSEALGLQAPRPARLRAVVAVLEAARASESLRAALDTIERRTSFRGEAQRSGDGDILCRRLFYCRRHLLRLAQEVERPPQEAP